MWKGNISFVLSVHRIGRDRRTPHLRWNITKWNSYTGTYHVCPPQRASSLGPINVTPTLLPPGPKEFCSSDDLGIQPAKQYCHLHQWQISLKKWHLPQHSTLSWDCCITSNNLPPTRMMFMKNYIRDFYENLSGWLKLGKNNRLCT